jgi:uncharacterized membrane protein
MYLTLKLVHIAAVIAFLGNIATGLFWHAHAARTRDPRLLHHAMDGIIRSDKWITLPGVALIIASGVLAAIHAQLPLLRTPWITWSLALFTFSGIIYGVMLVPLQLQLRAMAREGLLGGTFDYPRYHALAIRWDLWGLVSLLAPVIAMVLMVLKPGS